MKKERQDLAWSLLPKEFKEEVKTAYKRLTSTKYLEDSFSRGMKAQLETLFGHHNLTSDAEGEEMLTVPRKKVQEFYVKCKEVTKNPYSYPDYSHESALSRMALLDILFGSKCLPDEAKDDAKDNKQSNVDSLGSKPSALKYQIGQTLRHRGAAKFTR